MTTFESVHIPFGKPLFLVVRGCNALFRHAHCAVGKSGVNLTVGFQRLRCWCRGTLQVSGTRNLAGDLLDEFSVNYFAGRTVRMILSIALNVTFHPL